MRQKALAIVAIIYINPKSPLLKENSSLNSPPKIEIKKVCPELEKKLAAIPKARKRQF